MPIFFTKPFPELSLDELHDLLRLRQEIFIIEQTCIYPDIDGLDADAIHVLARDDNTNELVAYARILPPGLKIKEPAIGRVLTHSSARGGGLGRALMVETLKIAQQHFPGQNIKISAQDHLERFYQGLGFSTVSEPYDDDGIMHIDMLLESTPER